MYMSWITAEQVMAIHTGVKNFKAIPVRPYAKFVERGIVVQHEDFVIAYQVCFNNQIDEVEKEMGVEPAYDMDCVFCDRQGNTVDIDGLYEVFTDKNYLNSAIKDVKDNWRSKIADDVYQKLKWYKQGEIEGHDLRPNLKRRLKTYEFMLKKYFPALYALAPSEIFNRG